MVFCSYFLFENKAFPPFNGSEDEGLFKPKKIYFLSFYLETLKVSCIFGNFEFGRGSLFILESSGLLLGFCFKSFDHCVRPGDSGETTKVDRALMMKIISKFWNLLFFFSENTFFPSVLMERQLLFF